MRPRSSVSYLGSLVIVLWMSATASADPFTFDTLPADGAITGAPGTTIGWGFTITDPSANLWLVLTGVSADVFSEGVPDASIFFPPVIAPGQTISIPYDLINATGLFQLTWDPSAPPGFTNPGTFIVSGEFFTDDPSVGGVFVAAADDQMAPYSATVADVPEPATTVLLSSGLAWLLRRRKRVMHARRAACAPRRAP